MPAERRRECTRSGVTRARARAEAREWEYLHAEVRAAEASETVGSFAGQAAVAGVVLDLAGETGWSEFGVRRRANAAETLIDHSPATWTAFMSGEVDAARALMIADTVARLERPDSKARLDDRVAAYAATHSVAELRRWLGRFVARVEGDLLVERAERAREGRSIEATYGDDSMGWLVGHLPAPHVAAIDARLDHAARALDLPDDHRTLAQKKADLFAAWLTHGDESVDLAGIRTDIAVVVTAEALVGEAPDLVSSYDGHWHAPLGWLTELMDADTTHLWHRITTTPSGDLLDHTFLGRFYPDLLSKALEYRDQVCRAPGCTVPARRCDLDHRVPHPVGPTSADNGQHLCRRHHRLKSHGGLVTLLDGHTYSLIRPSPAEQHLNALLAG